MKKRNTGAAEVILSELASGPVPRDVLIEKAKALPGGRMAISRLMRRREVTCEYRRTTPGSGAKEPRNG